VPMLRELPTRRVLVVAPALDEVGKIGRVVSGVLAMRTNLPELDCLVVDDGSRDGTAAEARAHGGLVISHARNLGVGAAIRTGIEYARQHHYGVVCVISGDDQHDASDLPAVIEPVLRGEVDLAQGSRYLRDTGARHPAWHRFQVARALSYAVALLYGWRVTDVTNGLRAIRVSALGELAIDLSPARLDSYELEPYLLIQLMRRGRWREVPVTVRYHRTEGYTKMKPIRDWWRLLRPFLALRFGVWS